MIRLVPGAYAYTLLDLLSAVGEYPAKSLSLLGNPRAVQGALYEMAKAQEVWTPRGTQSLRLVTLSGESDRRTIRLTRKALPLLDILRPGAQQSYLERFDGHHFSGNANHVWRNHRVAEVAAMLLRVGVEIRPYCLPTLLPPGRPPTSVVPDLSFYAARDLKNLDPAQRSKTSFTRMAGTLFAGKQVYALYNTREAVRGYGEAKAAQLVEETARTNAPGYGYDRSTILLGRDMDMALRLLQAQEGEPLKQIRFDTVYEHIHFVPMDSDGLALLWLLSQPGWRERVLSSLFPDVLRVRSASVECDAVEGEAYILSHLDGDLLRLMRFQLAVEGWPERAYVVVCYPWQAGFLRAYLGDRVDLRVLDFNLLRQALEGD